MKAHSDTKQLQDIYQKLLSHYGPQGWWPLYNKKTRDSFNTHFHAEKLRI